MSTRAPLPDLETLPPQALRSLILVQAEEIAEQRVQLQAKDEQLAGRQAEIERLQLLIAKRRRMQFGRRSEKLARQEMYFGRYIDQNEIARSVDAVTAEQVLGVAQEFFHPERLAITVLGPVNGLKLSRANLGC